MKSHTETHSCPDRQYQCGFYRHRNRDDITHGLTQSATSCALPIKTGAKHVPLCTRSEGHPTLRLISSATRFRQLLHTQAEPDRFHQAVSTGCLLRYKPDSHPTVNNRARGHHFRCRAALARQQNAVGSVMFVRPVEHRRDGAVDKGGARSINGRMANK